MEYLNKSFTVSVSNNIPKKRWDNIFKKKGNNIMYNILYIMLLVGFLGCSLYSPSLRMKAVGILLTLVNGLLFFKG